MRRTLQRRFELCFSRNQTARPCSQCPYPYSYVCELFPLQYCKSLLTYCHVEILVYKNFRKIMRKVTRLFHGFLQKVLKILLT
jgi:hypothetical protein